MKDENRTQKHRLSKLPGEIFNKRSRRTQPKSQILKKTIRTQSKQPLKEELSKGFEKDKPKRGRGKRKTKTRENMREEDGIDGLILL